MAVKVAINGFGRIGRLAFRQMFGAEGYEVVAINDLTSPKMLAHLLKYDSSQGKYEKADTVSAGEDSITVDGKTIKIYAKPDANDCPWGELGVDVVLECSGFYTSKEKAQAHINAGARKVVISAPAGNDLPTIVYNTNHETLKAEDTIISAASCTTNCLAPMVCSGTVWYHGYDPCLHRRSDDTGRPAEKRRSQKIPCRCSEHRAKQHGRSKGDRPCYPGTERQTDRFCSACSDTDRFYDDPDSSSEKSRRYRRGCQCSDESSSK